MPGGRAKLPVLAEIAGPGAGGERLWSLRRDDFAALEGLLGRLDGQRAVLVTGGAAESAGLAVALAGVASAGGRRAVLLECELERPRLAAELGLAAEPGLHEYLRWEATAPEIVQPLVLAGAASAGARTPLTCVTAGRPASDPRTLFGLQSFGHAIAKLRGAYEVVVIAGPGLESGREAVAAVAGRADATLAALGPQQAKGRGRRVVRAALRRLPSPPLGAVVVGAA